MLVDARVRVPDLAPVVSQLRAVDDPLVALLLAREVDGAGPGSLAPLRVEVERTPTVRVAAARQRADGSWGRADDGTRRVLPTLWMLKALTELGLATGNTTWDGGADFLGAHGLTDDGVFSRDGTRGGVLSCYVGVAAEVFRLGGREDLTAQQVEWLLRHQEVRCDGVSRRSDGAATWDDRLRSRYGGCFAATTCLIGIVKAMAALDRWGRSTGVPAVQPLVAAMREVVLERRLVFRSDGGIVPLGSPPSAPDRWLRPAFPLDWHTDLVEVVDTVARSGPADVRLQPALDLLVAARLPDGWWPLRHSYRPDDLLLPERVAARRGSAFATVRAVAALRAVDGSG